MFEVIITLEYTILQQDYFGDIITVLYVNTYLLVQTKDKSITYLKTGVIAKIFCIQSLKNFKCLGIDFELLKML